MTKTNLDYYRFEYYGQSYSPLGRIKQDELYQQVLEYLRHQLKAPTEFSLAKRLITQYFSYLRSSPSPQIIVANSHKFDALLSQIAHTFNNQNLFFHLTTNQKQTIASTNQQTYNLLPQQWDSLNQLPYISSLILGSDFSFDAASLAALKAKLNRDGHLFELTATELNFQRLGQTKGILGSESQAQELRTDFNRRLELLTTLTTEDKLAAILALEADYYRYYDYLDLASVELIEQINQLKNETLSILDWQLRQASGVWKITLKIS